MFSKKSYVLIFCLFTFLSNLAFSQTDSLKIAGEIHFKKPGNIFILLVDEETFKIPLTGVKKQILKITEKNLNAKKVSYKFEGIKPGIYGIRCFQDVNGNKKLDKGMFGPKEPWGMTCRVKNLRRFQNLNILLLRWIPVFRICRYI